MSTEQKQYIKAQVKSEGGKITVIASDATVDRHGDSIPVESWDLKNFLAAPVMLLDHNYTVEKIVGAWQNPHEEDGKLVMDGVFHEITELAKQAKAMVDEGFLRDVSVGFIPHYETKKAEDGTESTVSFNELLEVSWVAVGANPSAKVKSMLKAVEKVGEDVQNSINEFVKGFTVVLETKEVETEAKGEVADEVARQEMMDQKYSNLRGVFEIVYAMADVYMQDETPVENFNTLLGETADLLKNVAGGAEVEQESVKVDGEFALKMAGVQVEDVETDAIVTKEGKVLSKKNRELISKSVDSLKGSATVLQELLDATDAPSEDGIKQVPAAVEQKETDASVVVIERSFLEHLQGQLRVSDRNTELSIRLIKEKLNPKQ